MRSLTHVVRTLVCFVFCNSKSYKTARYLAGKNAISPAKDSADGWRARGIKYECELSHEIRKIDPEGHTTSDDSHL